MLFFYCQTTYVQRTIAGIVSKACKGLPLVLL